MTVSLTGTASRTYDGTTTAALADANYSLAGIISGDTVVLNDPTTGSYDTKNAGTGKTVSVSGLSLSGIDAGNYTLSSTSVGGAIGTINQALLTASLTGTASRTYDGTTTATLADANYSLAGIISGDTVVLNDPTTGSYDTKNAGTGKTVSVSGLSLSGIDAGNYTLSSTSVGGAIGTINQALLTASLTGTASRTYDGTTTAALTDANYSLAGLVDGDNVAVAGASGTYVDKNVGTGKTVSVSGIALTGADAANYVLTGSTLSGAIGTITPASLTVTVNDASRVEGTANPAFGVTLGGLVGGDTASVLSGLTVSTSATMDSLTGTYAIVSAGGTAANYVITVRNDGTLTITSRPAIGDVPGLNNALPASNTNYVGTSFTPFGSAPSDDTDITGATGSLICDVSNSDSTSEACRATN